MQTYIIRRRHGWRTPEELEQTAVRSRRIGEEMPAEVRWIRTYVVREADGTLGTVCVYQAVSAAAIEAHAARVGMPADEIMPSVGTVLVRPDPIELEAQAAE